MVPPGFWFRSISSYQCTVQFQAFKVLPDQIDAVGIKVDRRNLDARRSFQQMTGFATGCSTGVKDPHSGFYVQQIGSQLCGWILHRK